jgi:hypothetical protein
MIAIDPGGTKGCAVAHFAGGALDAVLTGCTTPWATRWRPALVIVERPQVDGRTRGRERGVLDVAWNGALLAGYVAGVSRAHLRVVEPGVWKGAVAKPVHHKRLWAVLHPAERAVLGGAATERAIVEACERGAAERWRLPGERYYRAVPGAASHDALDAAALGCWALERLAGPR